MPGETLSLKEDYKVGFGEPGNGQLAPVGHLIVDGKELTAATPRFENLYSFDGAPSGAKVLPFKENHYFGHALLQDLSHGREVKVGPDNYFVMGDNTFNSSDGRYWGDFPKDRVIGKSFFIYWPISDRFGFGYH
jgi:signal peptidase I